MTPSSPRTLVTFVTSIHISLFVMPFVFYKLVIIHRQTMMKVETRTLQPSARSQQL